jgi:hypothetical protein
MDDAEFLRAVEGCTLPGERFRHADHVRLAWLYLRDHPLLEAIARYTATLKRFAAHHGAPRKYHATITWAYLLLIHERMHITPTAGGWDAFCRANADLLAWQPSVLERYYDAETLASPIARETFVLPRR